MTTSAQTSNPTGAVARSSGPLKGRVFAPGDKSISHRAIIMGALAEGETTVSGLLEGADILSTIGAMRAFGADISKTDDIWHVIGCGSKGFRSPDQIVDCGNAGTGVRLIMGAVAGHAVTATFTGDASLRGRPMGRILIPLEEMGVSAASEEGARLPVTITSDGHPVAIEYTPKQASAQVKSAVLLAGLGASGETTVREPRLSRDHTENMLKAFGVEVTRHWEQETHIVSLNGPARLKATHIDVPGDPSSAAFLIVAALIVPGSDVVIQNIMINRTRTGLFTTLLEMGGDIEYVNRRWAGGESVADIRVKHSRLNGVAVPADRAPSMIDEYPILAIAAAFATGKTHMPGIHELRVKESDRIAATLALLSANGVSVSETPDSLTVTGGDVLGSGHVTTYHDHRIAMSALILGLASKAPVSIDDSAMIATSFPSFFELMTQLGASLETQT